TCRRTSARKRCACPGCCIPSARRWRVDDAISPSSRRPRRTNSLHTAQCAELENAAKDGLASHGWRPDYIAVRRRADLAPPGADDRELVTLGAAWLGRTRLIDNLEI